MTNRTLQGALYSLLLAGVSAATAQAQDRGFEPADYYRLTTVDDVALSPQADKVAFTVTTVVESDNRRHREIWLQPLSEGAPDGEPYRITSPTEESRDPVWSPDGSLLAFHSERGDDPNPVWFLRFDGSGGEAFHLPGVDGRPEWSPDGSRIAFVRAPHEAPSDSVPREGWISPDAVSNTLDAERFDGRVITTARYKRDGTPGLLAHPSARLKKQLFVVPASGGEPRQLTRLAFDVSSPLWSADGLHIFFEGDEAQDVEGAPDESGDLWVAAAAGASVTRLTDDEGSERDAALSPDGGRLAYLWTPERGAPTDLMVMELAPGGGAAGPPRNVTEAWDLEPGSARWSDDGRRLSWSARTGGDVHLFSVSDTGNAVTQLTAGERQVRNVSFSADGRTVAYTSTNATTPAEVFVSDTEVWDEVRVTDFNGPLLAELTLMDAEPLSWRVEDGTEIEGWVMKPVGFEAGRSYPMILKIHGGPHSSYGNTFFPTFHVLSGAGFFVLYSNPRGSAGYGHDFEYATREQWGILDREDFLAGVDAALARYPDVDADRLGVAGGSYGGFMTNWLTATTDRFDAAVTSRSISNWESWWGTTDVPGLTEYEFGGTPWERRDLYRRLSPISYVENVTAPTLIIHSELDYRTPMPDAEQWFLALKKLEVPTELVRYPRSSHGLSRTGEPWLLVDRLERIRSWFVHFLIEDPSAVAASP